MATGRKRQRDPIEEIFDLPTILREQRETMLARMEASEKRGWKQNMLLRWSLSARNSSSSSSSVKDKIIVEGILLNYYHRMRMIDYCSL